MTTPKSPATPVSQAQGNPSDPRNREVVNAGGEPFVGNLATPVNASSLTLQYFRRLPAYRPGLTSLQRGLEVGIAHGYWLIGPFAKFNPLRDTGLGIVVGLSSTIGLLVICYLCISLYAASQPPVPQPTLTTPVIPDAFKTATGWQEFGTGFLIGGLGGAIAAFLLLSVFDLLF